jgi:D-glycero-beta-D-manno-heptose 1-phosphate adenylyltransferase
LPEKVSEIKGYYFNTLSIIGENGCCGQYRKQHLFPGEEVAFARSTANPLPVQTHLGTFGCMICYDIRFPDIARGQCQQGADLLLCASAWPAKRIEHLRALAIARAIENQTYLVSCNGIGRNGEFDLGGHSLIVSPDGKVLFEAGMAASAAFIPVQWSLKEETQRQFNSFAVSPFPLLNEMKIVSADSCIDDVEKRSHAGQRVILVHLKTGGSLAVDIEALECARCLGDHLVVAARTCNLQQQASGEAGVDSLEVYAALGCVGAIFPFASMTPSIERRFKKICSLILPAGEN